MVVPLHDTILVRTYHYKEVYKYRDTMTVSIRDTIVVVTFSENTKNGDGKVVASLEKFTLPLWIRAALASVVRT